MDDAGLSRDLAAMSQQQRSVLLEGWLSPRMKRMLTITAEINGDIFLDDVGLFQSYEPTSLERCCDPFGINRIDYIPLEVLRRDPRGLFQSFHDGYAMCFEAIAAVLRRNQAPTVQRVRNEIECGRYDNRKFRHYIDRGGRIEYALYAVIQVTENVLLSGDDGWEYETFQDEIEALPSNPLDGRFEVARVMCINRGGGTPQAETGPFREVTLYGNDRDEGCDYGDY